jgi:FkbM family methyltransferase
LLNQPIYHADCLLQNLEQRLAKAKRYEQARPGHRNEGFPVNAMYVPEVCDGLETQAVPQPDQASMAQLLDQSLVSLKSSARKRTSGFTRKEDIVLFNSGRMVSPNAYQASVTIPSPRPRLPVATHCGLDVVVRNLGDEHWPAAHVDSPPIRLGCRWLDAASSVQVAGEGRTGLPALVKPGEEAQVRLGFETPGQAGEYLLEVDVVHEGVRWFGCGSRMPVALVAGEEVSPQPTGPRFMASYGLDGIDLRLVELINPECGGTFIEAGANDGVQQSNTLLLERSFGWHGLLVEPVARLAEQCRRNRPGAVVEQAALVPFGHADETVPMADCGLMSLVAGAMGDESADAEHLRRGSDLQGGLAVENLTALAVPLSRLIDRYGLGRVDLLVLDVEGYEAPALRGIDMARHAPRHLLIEARFRDEVEAALGVRYEPVAELSHHDVLYRRSD